MIKNLVFSLVSDRMALRTKLSMGSILILVAVLLLAGCAGKVTEGTSPTAVPAVQPDQATTEEQAPPSSSWDLSPQIDDGGRVTIEVTPLTLSDEAWEFKVALNTHSVDLSFDLTEVGALRCDRGQEFQATAWNGSGPGGHHRSGVLQFAALDHPTSFVEVVIRDVSKVPERVFRWQVSGETGSTAETSVTQSSTPQLPTAEDDGPARVTLSDQEFHFGDVVMSRGAVQQTIEITNDGTDVLRIEGVDPT